METKTDSNNMMRSAELRQLKAQLAPSWKWKSYAFEVKRRAERVALGKVVKPRIVVVHCPLAEAAPLGAGVASDEVFRPVPVPMLAALGASAVPSKQDMADFFEALGSSMGAGQSLRESLQNAARVVRSARLRGIIGTLCFLISKGHEAHQAFALFPDQFTAMVVALIASAKQAGADEASKMYLSLAKRIQKEGKTLKKFIGAFAYPLSILLLAGVGSLVLAMKALPAFAELFLSMDAKLPAITAAYYSFSKFLLANWWWVFPVLIGSFVTFVGSIPVLSRKAPVQRQLVKVPYIGGILMCLAIARAFSTFVLLRVNGATQKECFQLAGAAAGNIVISDFFDAAYRRVASGETIPDAITAERDALGDDGQRIAGKIEIAGQGGDLNVLMDSVVDELNDRADTRLTVLPVVLNLPLLVIVVLVLGSMALAITLPMPNLIAETLEKMHHK